MKVPFFYKLSQRVVFIFLKLFFRLQIRGEQNVPGEGRIILASNHIAALDPPVIGASTRRMLFYLAKKELFSVPVLKSVIKRLNAIPVDRGAGDIKAIKIFTHALNNDNAALLFPEGTRSRDGNLGEAKEGIGMIALKTNSDIIPCLISGTDNLKQNFLKKNGISITFGNCINIEPYKNMVLPKRDIYKKISQDVLNAIKQLKDTNSN
ncbi:1-acyl-sn-glycerol-3-phosphate acyltransferase [candidate division KSB1 bacterium]|nr:1-acyl-sn-glycerol-3-phosphate acyltransferase [candidate division KSB1 bacterium]